MLLYIVFSLLQDFERVFCSDDSSLRPGEIPWLHIGIILLKVSQFYALIVLCMKEGFIWTQNASPLVVDIKRLFETTNN